MAFGSKARQVSNFSAENGGNGTVVFFPLASGDNGASIERTFRMLADEDEVVYREWAGEVTVNGQKTYRSCIVANDNYFDTLNRQKADEIKAEAAVAGKSDDELKELLKAAGLKWTKQVFAVNVINRDSDGKGTPLVQVLKSSYEPHKEDEAGNLVPAKSMGGKTFYAKLISLIRTGARVPDPKNPRRAITVNDPAEFDIIVTTSGKNLGKKHDLHVGFVSPVEEELLDLPRYQIEAWAKGTGTWPNVALERLAAGEDYYTLVKEFKIALYPELPKEETVAAPVKNAPVEVSEDDELFEN